MKTIGLIGGMSLESTVTYYRLINEAVKQRLGGLHSARLVLYSVDLHESSVCSMRAAGRRRGHYRKALRQPHVRETDFTGKPIKGYVYFAPEGVEEDGALEAWVNICAEFIESLPPK